MPGSGAARLSFEIDLANTAANPYDSSDPRPNQIAPFTHLLNFFNASPVGTPGAALDLANILEYLQTPSPFVGTEIVLNPSTYWWNIPIIYQTSPVNTGAITGEPNTSTNPDRPGTGGHGRLASAVQFRFQLPRSGQGEHQHDCQRTVWKGILGGTPPGDGAGADLYRSTPDDPAIVPSRRGYDVAAAARPYAFDDNSAVPKAAADRSSPIRSVRRGGRHGSAWPTPSTIDMREKPVNATLWRAEAPKAERSTSIVRRSQLSRRLMLENLPTTSINPYNDWRRNAYFAYQPYGQLVNKLTTRSNVYAVWITVGYFEVTPWYGWDTSMRRQAKNQRHCMTFDAAHPDGYQLGQEIGSDTGDIKRHRGFYIIDRTIPVGFQRGRI